MIDFADPEDDDETLGPVVPFVPFRCPHCGACKPRTTGQRGRKRYHRCKACGRRYLSWELTADSMRDWRPPPTN